MPALAFSAGKKNKIYQKGWIDFNKNQTKDIYEDPAAPLDDRVEDLLQQMTLEEKAGQLLAEFGWPLYTREGDKVSLTDEAQKVVVEHGTGTLWGFMRADPWTQKTLKNGLNPHYAIEASNLLQHYCIEQTRLGIPMFLAEECPHGHMAIGTTAFPTAIGQASTWNPELLQQMGEAQAMEIRKQGAHIGYGPVIDLARDPRWSRVEEGFGEDPFLAGKMGAAVVRGMQDNENYPAISTVKHFTAYGWTEGGHNGGSAHIGEYEMNELILPPFKEVTKAGLLSMMTSYNEIDGIPCTGNRHLITEVLKEQWGFKGFVVSDLYSIDGMTGHGVVANRAEAGRLAAWAGVDSDLGGICFRSLPDWVRKGELSQDVLDDAVRKILRLKFQWKLFDQPFLAEKSGLTQEELTQHRELAREVARQSIILLKNEQQTLPLSKEIRSIAVIGPNADTPYNMLGDYTAPQAEGAVITVLEGIKRAVSPQTTVRYAKGCAVRDTSSAGFAEALEVARQSDVIVLALGGSSARDFSAEFLETGAAKASQNQLSDMESGEGNDRCTLDLLGRQNELLDLMKSTGKPVVVVLIKGRPLAVNQCVAQADALIDAWYPGFEGGNAIADVLFGDYNPAGRLTISVPKNVGQLPVFYNHKRSQNRSNYVEGDAKPLYPFGYGLSYTSFSYDRMEVVPSADQVEVRVTLTNRGDRAGEEVIQLYVQDVVSSHTTPFKQLKGFKRQFIRAGESETVRIVVPKEELMLYQGQGVWKFEPGEFRFMVGGSSESLPLQESVVL
ncbi:MAG: glycoside hydrolase family 3 N-terminal domain-containing protein [Parabacteroides sp.]|nr:glycoside hydrolase family 3 N-terminal domain-containing protein [bacterium]MDY4527394.1 glycoside hydrolase family 3 N-terminal domain-containing protein [Parabacteroides sp.]